MDYLSGDPRGHPHQIKCLEQRTSVSLSPHLTLFIRSLLTLQSRSQIDGENGETNPCGLQSADFGPSDGVRIHKVTCEGEVRMGVNRGDGSIIAYFKLFLQRVKYECVDGLHCGV